MKGENEMALPTTAFYLISHYGAGLDVYKRQGMGRVSSGYSIVQRTKRYMATICVNYISCITGSKLSLIHILYSEHYLFAP